MKPTHSLMAIAVATALFASHGAHAQSIPAAAAPDGSAEVRQQGGQGIVSGSVREAARGASLPGARVSIGERSTVTAADGSFRLPGIAPGRHVLRVDYLGYEAFSTEITVADALGLRAEVVLRSTADGADAETLGTVEVRATRDAQALALNQQRESRNLRNVVSADLLGRFPDANVAEATQRIPGVSIQRDQGEGRYVNVRGAPLNFTSVSLDGVQLAAPNQNVRSVELDTVPSDVIATLEVTKALTPDMDADAIAGAINIVTQSALDRNEGFVRGSVGAGRYELGQGENLRGNVTLGQRFGAERNIGVLLGASTSKTERFTDNVETVWGRGAGGQIVPEEVEIKDYDGDRERTGVTARVDARINEDHLVYFIGSASRFRDEEIRNTFLITLENLVAGADDQSGIAGRATFDKEIRARVQEQTIDTFNLGGEHWAGDWMFTWQGAYSEAEQSNPVRDYFIYRSTRRPRLSYDYSNPDFPVFTQLNPDGSVLQPGINLPESVYAFRRYEQRFVSSTEEEWSLRLDATRPQAFLGESGDMAFGLRMRGKDKDADEDRRRNASGAAAPAYASLLCPRVSDNFGRFAFGRVYCSDVFDRFGAQMRNATYLPLVQASTVADYRAAEDITAAYVRLDAEWGALSMITGLRYEHTSLDGSANEYDIPTGAITSVETGRDYGKLLPSLHLRYELDEDTVLRTSYSTGISRPNFRDTVPRLVAEDNEAEAGNPGLRATYAHSLDLSVEHYVRPLGLLSAGVFYKRLEDPIFTVATDVVGGEFDGFRLTRPENGDSGSIYGVELAWQQTFDFLPGALDGLGVYANYTYAKSEADLPFGIGSTELPGTSRHNANLAVFWEKHGFNARLAWNARSEYIDFFDAEDRGLDTYWDGREIVDFTISYQVTPQLQLFGEGNNLTDSKQRRYQGTPSRIAELEQFGRFWMTGVRFEF